MPRGALIADRDAGGTPAGAQPMSQAAVSREERDLILGRYRALRPLGSGGSGSVWLARDEVEGFEVALKVVPREGKAGARAEREAAAVARLRHRHIARVYGVHRDARHVYVAYEYVPGPTLREALRSGLDDRRAVEAAAQLLEALAHAHAKRIVHRDVKPANVLLNETERGEVDVRLLDFGLATMEDAETLTATGDVPGTLSYISPERLRGLPDTAAADVWAVGVILWEALAGTQPFVTGSPVDTARAIVAGPRSLAEVRPDLPEALVEAVHSALQLDPRQRPAARRLAQDLRAALAVSARRRAQRPPLARRTIAERAGHAALAAGFVALATTLLPFWPSGFPLLLAALAGLAALAQPRAGLAFALATPVLPAGNVSLGLAAVYACAALAWLAAFWGDPRRAFLFVAGPLLALAGALPLLPLVAERAARAWRRALVAFSGVIAAGLVAGLRDAPLPFDGSRPPRSLGIAGSEQPTAVAGALVRALTGERLLLVEAFVLAAATLALPLARSLGIASIAVYASALPGLLLLVPPVAGADQPLALLPLLWTLALGAILALPLLRARAASYTRSR
jgi:hypothetical protein